MARGRFISLEGGEGCGKSTQAALLVQALEQRGIPCLLTREPGGEEGAEAIRRLLVEGDPERWEPVAETLLFAAARVQHVARVIRPALAQGTWVISDRFHDSTRVYQGVGKGLSEAYCTMLHCLTLGDYVPDMTLLLDIAPEEGLARTQARTHAENRFETMELAFHRAVREGFLAIARQEPERVSVIDAAQSPEQVQAAILAYVKK